MILHRFRTISSRLTVTVGIAALAALLLVWIYASVVIYNRTVHIKQQQLREVAQQNIDTIDVLFNQALMSSQSLSSAFKAYMQIPEASRRYVFDMMLQSAIETNTSFTSTWTIWEHNAIDNLDTLFYSKRFDYSGRYSTRYFRENTQVQEKYSKENIEVEARAAAQYIQPKQDKNPAMIGPYFYDYHNNNLQPAWIYTISTPIIAQTYFVGVTGTDILVSEIRSRINKKNFGAARNIYLVNPDGTYIIHQDLKSQGNKLLDMLDADQQKYMQTVLEKGETFFNTDILEYDNNDAVSVFEPFWFAGRLQFYVVITVPNKQIYGEAWQKIGILALLALVGMAIVVVVTIYTTPALSRYLAHNNEVLQRLAQGDISSSSSVTLGKDAVLEIQQITHSVNTLIEGLRNLSNFSQQIGKGNFDAAFTRLSDNDELGNSLLGMRKSLIDARKAEQLQDQMDSQRNWATQGVAKFSDIMRRNADNLNELSYALISNLVKYLDASQGAFYIANDSNKDNIVIEMIATFALDRKKHSDRKLMLGEGLVGTCAIEKETIYITKVPDHYIKITSGLGEATPQFLLMVPLLHNNQIFGVVEIAAFETIPDFKIKFVESIADIIASTLLTQKINAQTAVLLEQSKRQREDMAVKEEEMRQNLIELRATQERAIRSETEAKNMFDGINSSFFVADFDTNGFLLRCNDMLAHLYQTTEEELIGDNHRELIKVSFTDDEYTTFWNELRNGQHRNKVENIYTQNQNYWLSFSYVPIITAGRISKITAIGIDVSETKRIEKMMSDKQLQIKELEKLLDNARQEIKQITKKLDEREQAFATVKDEEHKWAEQQISMQQRIMQRIMHDKEVDLQKQINALKAELAQYKK